MVVTDNENQQRIVHHLHELQQEINELKKSKAKLRQNYNIQKADLHNYKTLLEQLPQGVFYKHRNGFYVSCNRSYAIRLRISPGEIAEKTDYDFYHADMAKKLIEADRHVLEGGKTVESELTLLESGVERTILFSKIPVCLEGDEIVGILGISTDITARKRWEQDIRYRDSISDAVRFSAEKLLKADMWETALHDVLERLGESVEVSRVYLFEKELEEDGSPVATNWHEWAAPGITPLHSNPRFQRLLWRSYGLERWEELLISNQPVYGIVQHLPSRERDFLSGQEVKTFILVPIFVNDRPWGAIGFDDCRVEREWSNLEINALNSAASILGVAIGKSTATKKIRASESRLRSITQSANEAIVCINAAGKIIFWNDAAGRMLCYAPDEILQKPITTIIPFSMRDAFFEKKLIALLQGEDDSLVKQEEMMLLKKDGHELPVELTVSAWKNDDEQFYSVIIRDITERKQAEQKLKKVREEYFTTLTHDLKGPLTAVMGCLYLLKKPQLGPISERKLECISMIYHNLEIMLSMIDNILDSSKIEEDRMPCRFENFSFHELLNELHFTFEAMAVLNNITLQFKCPDDTWIYGDRRMLLRVHTNLLNNALRHTPPGGRIVVLVASKGDRYEVSVSDTGCGIPPHYQEMIFQKYGKVKEESGGTGLGLYIVKNFLQAHGSEIYVESAPDQGTTFFFDLEKGVSR